MRFFVPVALCVVALAFAGCGGGSTGSTTPRETTSPQSSPTPAPTPTSTSTASGLAKIQHVVIIFQENRTPDNLFHGLPGADIANSGLDSHGNTIALQPVPLANSYDLDHSHTGFVTMYDGGKMDGANNVLTTCGTACPVANPQYAYVPSTDNGPYMQMAEQYAFADRMFQTNQGPSFPAHQYIISGTSKPSVTSPDYIAENPISLPGTTGAQGGCDAPNNSVVSLIDPTGSESSLIYPCSDHETLIDLLDSKNLSWRYYSTPVSIWVGVNGIEHLRYGPDWINVIPNDTQIFNDIANGQLPTVSWVTPISVISDHPRVNQGFGPSWVASIVNAIGTSPYWSNTAIFVTWDDWGGWYDHVAPHVYNQYELGFRVPLIAISPYARAGYVSHTQHEFASVLNFIEEANGFSKGSIGFTDTRADDLTDAFDFSQTPATFRTISSKYDKRYFLGHRFPQVEPDSDF